MWIVYFRSSGGRVPLPVWVFVLSTITISIYTCFLYHETKYWELIQMEYETVLLNVSKCIYNDMRIRTTLLNLFVFHPSVWIHSCFVFVVVLYKSTNWMYTIIHILYIFVWYLDLVIRMLWLCRWWTYCPSPNKI